MAQHIKWQQPLKIATKIADNYDGNWVFLYSALNKDDKEGEGTSKSYIALFEKDKFRGDDFVKFQQFFYQNLNDNSRNNSSDNFGGKWFGGLCYELCNQFENFTNSKNSHIKLDNIFFSKFALILEFNHQKRQLLAFSADDKLVPELLNYIMKNDLEQKNPTTTSVPIKFLAMISNIYSNFSDNGYLEAINSIKKMIAKGDFFQANLTRKFFGNFKQKLTPQQNFQIFTKLIKASPANYNFFARFEDNFIISSSPELFLTIDDNKIRTMPIKGSIARAKSPEVDADNKNYLQNSAKERAENLMIVDLMRNDFARFCKAGTVRVSNLFKISSYKTIHHLSSQIDGVIADNCTIFDALKNCFPPGSMTGAPKIKVIETLKNIEQINRGLYSGAFGYLDNKELHLAVVIRTLVINKDKFEFQVGGGITFDSNAESELQETYAKMRGILKALNLSASDLKKNLQIASKI